MPSRRSKSLFFRSVTTDSELATADAGVAELSNGQDKGARVQKVGAMMIFAPAVINSRKASG